MRLRSRNGWLLTLALVAGIATFTMTGAVYADDHGCKEPTESCATGTCGFVHLAEGDFCVCNDGQGGLEATCECSTGEYGPCGVEG